MSVSGKARPLRKDTARAEQGSGNIFADLGLPNPDLALAKAELVQRIRNLINDRKLTQAKAAKWFGLDQPNVSAIWSKKLERSLSGCKCGLVHGVNE
jgi:predicted XRE-type DNA-binding protein